MWNATHYTYEQFGTDGKVIDSFSSFVEILQRNDDHSKEKVMAIIVMCCSLAFLCYFIYSWVSCYMKRPRIREPQPQEPSGEMHEESATSGEEGYDMRPTPNAP